MPRKAPQVTVVYKPLPSKIAAESANRGDKNHAAARKKTDSAYLRAENEDDDGYDPYSDRREEPPLFERNPWD